MNKEDQRIERLTKVLKEIDSSRNHESDFGKLYNLLKQEYRLEGGDDAIYVMGSYNHNLSQTIEKQAKSYFNAKHRRPNKGAPEEYDDFVRHFHHDVSDELSGLLYAENIQVNKKP